MKYIGWRTILRAGGVWWLLAGTWCGVAQTPDTRIVEQSATGIRAADRVIISKAEVARSRKELLMDIPSVKNWTPGKSTEPLSLPKPSKKRLSPSEVAAKALAAHLKVGWYYLCKRCDKWHLNLSGGYAISTQGAVVTCDHVLELDDSMREGFLIASTDSGEVLPVIAILARNEQLDAAIIQVSGGKLNALPLNHQVHLGDAAYCYSDPLSQSGYFSAGLVNRFYWKRANRTGREDSLDVLCHLRMNVSTDWAPGSSGAAVLDECGNAIGHVSTISLLAQHERQKGRNTAATNTTEKAYMILHEAVPSRGILCLAKQGKITQR
ncbi:MAG: serine protease [Verrucomicrobiota bacterium]